VRPKDNKSVGRQDEDWRDDEETACATDVPLAGFSCDSVCVHTSTPAFAE
jgi:hypothetical protein